MADTETRYLTFPLTDEEHRLRGVELAAALTALTAAEEDKTEAMAEHKAAIKAAECEVTKLADVVRERRENRPVVCHWERNDERGTMELRREDTGAVVESRAMTDEERQKELFKRRTREAERGLARSEALFLAVLALVTTLVVVLMFVASAHAWEQPPCTTTTTTDFVTTTTLETWTCPAVCPRCPDLVIPPNAFVCSPTFTSTCAVGGNAQDVHAKCHTVTQHGVAMNRCKATYWTPVPTP